MWLWGQTHVNLKNRWSYTEYCYFYIFIESMSSISNPYPSDNRLGFNFLHDNWWWTSCTAGECESWFKCFRPKQVQGNKLYIYTVYIYICSIYKWQAVWQLKNSFFQHFARHNAIKLSSCSVKKTLVETPNSAQNLLLHCYSSTKKGAIHTQ